MISQKATLNEVIPRTLRTSTAQKMIHRYGTVEGVLNGNPNSLTGSNAHIDSVVAIIHSICEQAECEIPPKWQAYISTHDRSAIAPTSYSIDNGTSLTAVFAAACPRTSAGLAEKLGGLTPAFLTYGDLSREGALTQLASALSSRQFSAIRQAVRAINQTPDSEIER